MKYIIPALMSFVIAVLLVPVVKKFAFKVGAVDKKPEKNSRKIHTKNMARGGGIAIYLAFLITTLIFLPEHNLSYWGLVVASTIVLVVGFFDDISSLNPWLKLSVQIFAAILAYSFFGIRVEAISNPLGQAILFVDPDLILNVFSYSIQINILGLLLTTIWLVGMTNTMNFVDGIDGLSGGIAAIASIIMFFLALRLDVSQTQTALISIILFGGCVGYLLYNFHPAKIFNGDSGAYFLGMSLGIIAIFSGAKLATAALVLGVPIIDAVWSAIRRILSGKSPFTADRGHLHFLLLDAGFTQRQAALLIYAICLIFGIIALVASPEQKVIAIFCLVLIILLLLVLLSSVIKNKRSSS